MVINSDDATVSRVISEFGTWEPQLICILREVVKAGDTVFHLGTHVGLEAMVLA